MICALMLDLDDSPDFPDNGGVALGRPLSVYPLMAAKNSGRIDRSYTVTSSQPVKSAASQYGATLIDPPAETADAESHAEHLLRHGWRLIREDLGKDAPELLVVLFANAPALTGGIIQEGIDALHEKPDLDGAVTVSPNNRRHPACARRMGPDGTLEPYLADDAGEKGDVWFPNWSLQIIRPRCLEGKGSGRPPFPWLSGKIWPLKQWGGGAIDYAWQVPALEFWLKKQGVPDSTRSLEPQPLPKLAPKSDRR